MADESHETPDEARRRAANGESAYRRGEVAAATEARFRETERRLTALENSSYGVELRELRAEVRKVAEAFKTATAVAEARAKDLANAAVAQVSTRTFIVSLIVVAIARAGLILGTNR